MSTEDSNNDIKSVHGVRFFAVFMMFISHKSFFAYFYPIANRTPLIEETFKGSTLPIRGGFLYTELFLMLSGLLASFSMTRRLQQNMKINILREYVDRYWRVMPSLGVLILISTHVMPYIASGPLYKMLTEREADLCANYWWRNLLFVNVWFGVRPMCAFHTQHVAIDFELFLVAPFFVLLINKWPRKGLKCLLVLAVVSSLAKCFVAYQKNLSELVVHGLT
jgi:Acyltransferase family